MIHIPHLETDVTLACTRRCTQCNHFVTAWADRPAREVPRSTPQQVAQDLGHLSTIMHADRWGALGGEPLLAHDLLETLAVARASGVADRIEVWTNGELLRKQPSAFWEAFDILVVSIYPGVLTDVDVAWIQDASRAAGVALELKDERQPNFWRVLLEREPTDARVTAQKFANCFFRRYSRVANWGSFFLCCCAPHGPATLGGQPLGTDGIPIAGLTEDALRAYLNRTEPLGWCSSCALPSSGPAAIPWSEERTLVRWVQASKGLPVDEVASA